MFQNISEEYIKQNTAAREKKNKKINLELKYALS